jgi:flagellar biosynthetic protein FlhB
VAEESQDLKTLQPTPRKLEKARESGKVFKSTELTSGIMIFGALLALRLLYPWFLSQSTDVIGQYLGNTQLVENLQDVETLAARTVLSLFRIVGPFLGAVGVVALAANYSQVGFMFTTGPITPSLDKIDPVQGAKRLVSMKTLVKTGVNLAKAALVGVVFYYSIKGNLREYVMLGDSDVPAILEFIAREAFSVGIKAAVLLLILGFVDYAYQKREYIKNLMMTQHEMKEEFKEIEGSPVTKSRIRSVQKSLARQRMMKEVPEATVVVTNPTHVAVALKYEPETMPAPIVVAKGKRLLAERIKEIAAAHGVPVYENKPLARSLYDLVEVGEAVPESLYKTVAEILSYVYRLRGRYPGVVQQQ